MPHPTERGYLVIDPIKGVYRRRMPFFWTITRGMIKTGCIALGSTIGALIGLLVIRLIHVDAGWNLPLLIGVMFGLIVLVGLEVDHDVTITLARRMRFEDFSWGDSTTLLAALEGISGRTALDIHDLLHGRPELARAALPLMSDPEWAGPAIEILALASITANPRAVPNAIKALTTLNQQKREQEQRLDETQPDFAADMQAIVDRTRTSLTRF